MSVLSQTSKMAPQAMNGVAVNFAFSFRALVDVPEAILAIITDTTTDTDTTLIYNDGGVDGYTVAIDDDGVGGSITVNDARSADYVITVYREYEETQESNYADYNSFPAETVEDDYDKGTMIDQQITEVLDRTVTLPITVTGVSTVLPVPEANAAIGWDPTATFLVNNPANLSKVSVDLTATPDFIGATSGDGVLRTGGFMTYADGGDFVTLNVDEAALSHDNLIAGTIASHDTTGTGANVTTLTDGSNADALHVHSGAGIDQSLDDAYDDGSVITADTGAIVINSTMTATDALTINQNAVLNASTYAHHIYSNTDQTDNLAYLQYIHQDNAASIGHVAGILNDGTGHGLDIDQNGVLADTRYGLNLRSSTAQVNNSALLYVLMQNAGSTTRAAYVNNSGSGDGLFVTQGGVTGVNDNAFGVYSNAIQINSSLALFEQDNAGSTAGVIEILNDGTGDALTINQVGVLAANRHAIQVTTTTAQINAPLISATLLNVGADQQVLFIHNDGTGSAQYIEQDGLAANLTLDNNGNGSHIQFLGDPVVAAPVDGDLWYTGVALNFYDGGTTYNLLAADSDEKVKIDAAATAGYLGAAAGDGVLRTDGTITYTDGGDFVTLNVTDNTSVQQVEVTKNSGGVVGTRPQLNFIEGANVTLTVADDAGNDQVDITIAAAGGGGGSLQAAFDVGQTITIGNGDNQSLAIANNDVTNNPNGFVITNTSTGNTLRVLNSGTGYGINLQQNAVSSAATYGLLVYSDAIQVNEPLVNFNQDNASSTQGVIRIDNDGSGTAQYINNDGSGFALSINQSPAGNGLATLSNNGTKTGVKISQAGVLDAGESALWVYSNADQDDSTLVFIEQDNAASDETVTKIQNDGTGQGLSIAQYGNGTAERINNFGTDYGLYIGQVGVLAATKNSLYVYSNAAQVNAPLAYINQDNASSTKYPLEVRNDGTSYSVGISSTGGGGVATYIYNTMATGRHAYFATSSYAQSNADTALVKFHKAVTSGTDSEPVLEIIQDYASGSGDAVWIQNDGTGSGIELRNNSSGHGIQVENGSTGNAIYAGIAATLAASKHGLYIYSIAAQTNSQLVKFHSDHASSSDNVLEVVNDGTGIGLYVDQNGNGIGLLVANNGAGATCAYLQSTNNGPQLLFAGDPTVAAPADGAMWYTGSELYFRDGGSTVDLLSGVGFSNIEDYGNSSSSSTTKNTGDMKLAYGYLSIAGDSTVTITNLNFTSTTSYVVNVTWMDNTTGDFWGIKAIRVSASSFTIRNTQGTGYDIMWQAIGT